MIAFITHPDCILHDLGDQHPERPARLREINQHIDHSDVATQLTRYTAETVTEQQLLRAHDQTYLQQIYQQSPQNPGEVKFIDADKSYGPIRRASIRSPLKIDLRLSTARMFSIMGTNKGS